MTAELGIHGPGTRLAGRHANGPRRWPLPLLLGLVVCAGLGSGEPPPVDQVRADRRVLDFTVPAPEPSAAEAEYFRYYGLDVPGVTHRFGTFESGGRRLAAHVFQPEGAQAAVLIVHGYYDHVGVWRHVIRRLIVDGYAVLAFDQPGHGLSDGPPADIGDFGDYLVAFRDSLALVRANLASPLHVVAHSMGAGIVMDYLLQSASGPDELNGQVVLLAPLVRSAWWRVSGVAQAVTPGSVAAVPRVFRTNSSDPEFLDWVRRDPLQAPRVPTAWVRAHRRWVGKMRTAPRSERPLLVIQGDADTTVDGAWNLRYIRGRFTQARVVTVRGAGHQLMNEAPVLRDRVLALITTGLDPAAVPAAVATDQRHSP